MANNPTVVIGSLNDDELKKSIDKLVSHVDKQLNYMVSSTKVAVMSMQNSLKSLGDTKIDFGGAANGGATKRTKAQNEETAAIKESTQAYKDKKMALDQMASSQQVAIRSANPSGIRNADTLQTMNIQLDLLRERLREARQQYSSFVALAAHATTTGDKGLFQYATDGVHRYEQEVRNLIPQIRGLQDGIQQMGNVLAPQGHTIQNYVNSLQKANPELAQLNEQYKRGQSLLQEQTTSISSATNASLRYSEAIRRQAQTIRESQQWKEKGYVTINGVDIYNLENSTKNRISLEEQLVKLLNEEKTATSQVAHEQLKVAQNAAATNEQLEKARQLSNKGIGTTIGEKYGSVPTFTTQLESANALSKRLKELKEQYNSLSFGKRLSAEGQAIAQQIREITRQGQKLNNELNRPTKKEVFGLSEKTLDDIAYKMRQLSTYRGGLDASKQTREITQVNDEYNRLKKRMDEVMQKNQQMIASNTALGRSWNYMKNRLAFYFTVGASTQFVRNLIEVRSQYEMNERALGILIDSAERGTQIFNELSQMALVSPYTLIELSNAAKQLTAYDIAAKDVVDTTRRLADMASAVGVPVERLTYALGQIKAYGYLNSRDARMFANAGIPLVKQLADRYSELEGKMVSTADVYDRMKKKAIDYNDVMAVINKMTDEGGKFFDFQAKMAETLKVRLANLTLAWNNMLNDMGKDNQGVMTTGLKGLTLMFKHWREIYRVISTVIVALGAYRVATMLAGMATKSSIGGSAVASWFSLAKGINSAKDAAALFSLTLKSIPFTAWVTAIATLASYFILFNNSSDDVKQKLEGIKSAFDGVRKEVETMFADAIKTDNIGTQLTKLRDMLELAETELGVTIPIKLEDVNESNVRQKLKEAKQFIDEYVNFSQTFSEAAAGTKFNELMNDFGSKARSTYTNVTESINSVIVALQELSDKGQASKRDIEILNELTSGQKDDESRIEYLQRLVSLYEELGLIGKKVTIVPPFGSTQPIDNMILLQNKQEESLNRLRIKNKTVFENMLKDVQGYYSSSSIAAYQFEQQVMRVAEKIDINNIPIEQRTMKLTAAINEEASQNNWNQFEKEFARQIANERFGTTIEISDESKKAAEEDLQAWQRNIKEWAKNNGITFDVSFQTNDTEASYAKRMLQEAKDAKEIWETLRRKEKRGTGSKDATENAYNEYLKKRKLADAAGADLSSLEAKSRKAAKQAESELAKALKDELSTIEKVRSIYKDLTKEGMSHANAVERATKGWEETVNAINTVLQKNGLKKLNLSDFVGIENPREILKTLQSQLDSLVKRGASTSEIKVLQEKIQTVSVDADKYDLTKITKGLNSELDRLKEEYELAVSLDADPELGSIFADWMGFDMDNLPRTAQEYANQATNALNKALKERKADIELPNLLNITDDDLRELQNRVGTGNITQTYVDEITKAVKDVRGVFKKEKEDTSKEWDALIEKYGGLQAKLLKIYKDTVQQQSSIVKQFGSDEQISQALDLVRKIQISQDPAEIARLQEELAKVLNDVTKNNPVALKTYQATQNEQKRDESKANWEDFKESDLYTMTFEDMSRNSTRAIQLIIDKLNELKFKVKEDPASMKALTKSLEEANKEFESRSSTTTVVNGIKEYIAATKEVTVARKKLNEANQSVAGSEIALKNAQAVGDANAIADATERLERAREKQKEATENAAQAENKLKAAQEKIKAGLNVLSSELQNVQQLLGAVASLFEAAGDEETAEAINEISKGFSIMTTVIMGVVAAMIILETCVPWLLVIAAALSAIVGIVSFLSGNSNKKITEQVEESEKAVKRLENSYKKLEYAAEQAFGAATSGAQQALKANKELQLFELRRQLALEQSRSGKHYDEDKILDLKGQIIDLENEIKDFTKNAVDDLLGISSHGDFFEDMISEMIDAFKSGEDAMKVFEDKWSKMIDNMIMKTIVSQVLQNWVNSLEKGANDILEKYTKEQSDAIANINNKMTDFSLMDARDAALWVAENDKKEYENILNQLKKDRILSGFNPLYDAMLINYNEDIQKRIQDAYIANMQSQINGINSKLDKASLDATGELIDYYSQAGEEFKTNYLGVILDKIKENWNFGQDSENKLSQLQQGIQSVSETTAGALEAYMNGVSQQVYLHSELLTQIRDAIVGADSDIQLGVQGQMLLQLQNNYIIMQSIQSMMEGWTTPSGQGIRVELIS